jgi:hypothetical protein
MSGMKLWPRVVILALFSALPMMAQTTPLVFYNVDVFDGYRIHACGVHANTFKSIRTP